MKAFEFLKMTFRAMSMSKTRLFLTMIGIIVGIGSIVTIKTLGSTIQETVQNMVYYQSLNTFAICVGRRENEHPPRITDQDRISLSALDSLMEQYPNAFTPASANQFISGTVLNQQNERIKFNLTAAMTGFFDCEKKKLLSGRKLTQQDNNQKKYTAMVADVFVKQYFKNGENPLGKTLHLKLDDDKSIEVVIVGTYETDQYDYEAGASLMEKQTTVLIPYRTAASFSPKVRTAFTIVNLLIDPQSDRADLLKTLNAFLTQLYAGNRNYYAYAYDIQKDAEETEKAVSIMILIVSAISAISLLIGGIGVMNIMIVSVSERTKEIGLRKSIGATSYSILMQFGCEALMICLIGGVLGVLASILNCNIASAVIGHLSSKLGEYSRYIGTVRTIPSLDGILIAVGFSCLVGISAGLYPAIRAARMNPIDALRTE